MGNKLIIISPQNRRSVNYYKLTPDEQALLKKVWCGVENNPQFHGSSFFVEFCKFYPAYTKYFMTVPQVPLNVDGPNIAKFTVIMETIGCLVLDYHSKPKQLDQLVGYIAMVHKDMGLRRQDILNFGTCLTQYLCKTFSLSMDDASLEVFTKYFTSILVEMSFKMEEFLKDDRLNALYDEEDDEKTTENVYPNENMKEVDTIVSAAMVSASKNSDILNAEQKENRRETIRMSQQTGPTVRMLCGHWLTCRKKLIYGQSLQYWTDRKREWDDRLKYWQIFSTTNYTDPKMHASTSDEETYKSKTEDETASEMADVSISQTEITQATVAGTEDTDEATDELKEILIEQKVVPTQSINVSDLINDKSTRTSDIIKLSSMTEDANEIVERISTPRERRRTGSYLGSNGRSRNNSSSLESHDVKKEIPVESQELKDSQENTEVSTPTARISVQSARQRRRESRNSSLA